MNSDIDRKITSIVNRYTSSGIENQIDNSTIIQNEMMRQHIENLSERLKQFNETAF